MKKPVIVILIVFFPFLVFATPDRGVWVIDTLVGITNKSYIIKQLVFDNMGSHYQSRIQVYIIEKDLQTKKIKKNIKVTEYIESIDSNTGEKTRNNRSEDRIVEIIENNPDLFYDLNYVFPICLPNDHKNRSYLKENNIILIDENEKTRKYPLTDYVKFDIPAERIIEEYKHNQYRILLIEFGERSYEANYFQKIVVIE